MTSVSTDRRFGVNAGSAIKVPVRAASTANLTLSGEQTVDGVALVTGDRCLVKDQTTATQNGIYEVDTGAWVRTPDFDGTFDATKGTLVYVTDGSTHAGDWFSLTTTDPIIGTSSLTFIATLLGDASTVTFTQAGTGAVTRSSQDKLREIVSPEDFGAAGDGVTDDTTTATSAIATGKKVVFRASSTYLVSGLTLSNAGQEIRIDGVVKLKNTSNKSVFTINAHRVKINGTGEIDGNKANQSTTTDSLASAVWVNDGFNYAEVKGLYIHDCKRNGIAGAGNHIGCKYQDNLIDAVAFIGIYPSQASGSPFTRGIISGNVIISPTQDGIGTVGLQNCSIKGNTVYQPGVAGISLEARCDWTTVTANTVVGNAAIGSGTATGIQVNDSRNVTVTGNTLKKCGNGIGLSGGNTSQNVTVTGNTIDDCGYVSAGIALDTSVVGSYLSAYEYGITCTGNTILNSRKAGIFINAIRSAAVCVNYINGFNLELGNTINREMGGIVLRNFSHNCIVNNNRITDATGGTLKAGIIEVNDGSNSPAKNTYRDNQISGLDQDICVTAHGTDQSLVARPGMATVIPTANTWLRGQIQLHAFPGAGVSTGWISSDSKGGSFSTYASTGSITIGQATLTVASTDGLFEGMALAVAGAIVGETIVLINRTTKVVTLSGNASASVGPVAVTPYNPTFRRLAPSLLEGSAVFDPANLNDGVGTTTTVTVTGAALGDFAEASFSLDLQGITLTAWVSSANTVSVRFQNESGGALDLASGTLRARVKAL